MPACAETLTTLQEHNSNSLTQQIVMRLLCLWQQVAVAAPALTACEREDVALASVLSVFLR